MAPYNKQHVKIVFVEDNPDFCTALSVYFESNDYNAIVLTSISSLVSYVESINDQPHVFVLDRMLADGRSDDVFETIATLPLSRFLILTAYPSFESSVAALRSRAFEYLVKPVTLGMLEQKVAALCDEITGSDVRPVRADDEWDALIRTHFGRTEIALLAVHRCSELGITPSLSNISTVLGYSMSTVHRGVKALVRAGLAVCTVAQRDKRIKEYLLTEQGVADLQAIMLKLKKSRPAVR